MTTNKKIQEGTVADAIRAVIAKIRPSELATAKPGRVLPYLEAGGIEITASVRTYTSKLLSEARFTAAAPVATLDPSPLFSQDATVRQDLAMRFVEACDFNFDLVRAEIARLEEFAKKLKGA